MTTPSSPRAGRSTVSAAGEPRRFFHLNGEDGRPICYCGKPRPPHWDTCGGVVCGTTGKTAREAERDYAAASPAGPGIRNRLLVSRFDPSVSLDELIGAGPEAVPPSEREGLRAALEQAAKVAEVHAERLKHTSHRDGLGMGWQAGEELCLEIADRIRALASPAHPDEE